jgi:hypothetical protein
VGGRVAAPAVGGAARAKGGAGAVVQVRIAARTIWRGDAGPRGCVAVAVSLLAVVLRTRCVSEGCPGLGHSRRARD